MLRFFNIAFLLVINLVLGQSPPTYLIEYQVNYNSDKFIEKTAELIYDAQANKSYFIEHQKSNKSVNSTESIDYGKKTTESILVGSKSEFKINYIDFDKGKLYSNETITFNDQNFKVHEDAAKLNWNTNFKETREISKFICNKATINYRGRHYIAWFTTDLPIPAGPWKFRGLPGLIIEIYEETYKYEWFVTKITKDGSIGETYQKFLNNFKQEKKFKNISLKDYVILKDSLFFEKFKNIGKKVQSRQSRGISAEVKVNYNRLGKELIFEWEK